MVGGEELCDADAANRRRPARSAEALAAQGAHPPGGPAGAGASAPKAAQQVAGRRPKPAPARAQAVPKPRTAAQIARHERSQKQLRQKHLARKMWASVRIASRLLAWRIRAHALRCERTFFVNHPGLCSSMVLGRLMVMPIRVGKLLVQQWPSARARRPPPAALPAPPTSSAAAAQLLPALALAAPPPPSQQQPSALAAAARASLHPCEMQDDRGAKISRLGYLSSAAGLCAKVAAAHHVTAEPQSTGDDAFLAS